MEGYTDKYIFLPAAGYKYLGLQHNNTKGYYWTGTRGQDNYSGSGYSQAFVLKGGSLSEDYRYYGYSIRPVHPK